MWLIAGKNNMPDTYRDSPLNGLIPVELEPSNQQITADDEQNNPMVDPYRVLLTVEGRSHTLTRLDLSSQVCSDHRAGRLGVGFTLLRTELS